MEPSPIPSPLPTDLALTLTLSTSPCPPSTDGFPCRHDGARDLNPDERGIRLVHLLLACAAHAAGGDIPRADRCLGLVSALSSASGDTMQRLAARFAAALAARLLRPRFPGLLSALHAASVGAERAMAARLAFARALPYLPFARAVATGTILRAVAQEGTAVHVVALGWWRDPGLWAALLRGFGRLRWRPLGLRVTFVGGHDDGSSLGSLTSALLKEANLTEMPLRVDAVNASLSQIDTGMLRVDADEALAVVSVMSLHELLNEHLEGGPRESLVHQFLSGLRSLSPVAVVAVEREADHDSVAHSFVGGLHYYSALFDSVDAAAAAGLLAGAERLAVEEMLGREIEEAVGGREEPTHWAERFGRAGFRPAAAWRGALDEAKRVVDSYRANGVGGYSLAADGCRAVICWHDRPMYSVSAWQC